MSSDDLTDQNKAYLAWLEETYFAAEAPLEDERKAPRFTPMVPAYGGWWRYRMPMLVPMPLPTAHLVKCWLSIFGGVAATALGTVTLIVIFSMWGWMLKVSIGGGG